jgi:ankyrin repeat protein
MGMHCFVCAVFCDDQEQLVGLCGDGDLATVTRLLDDGANPNAKPNSRSGYGLTALRHACENGHDSIVALLIDKWGADLNAPAANGDTPLHLCCENGHDSIVALLQGCRPERGYRAGSNSAPSLLLIVAW